jgi:hypothetical protein
VRGWIEPLKKLSEAQGGIAVRLTGWAGALHAFSQSLSSLDGILAAKERLESGSAVTPAKLASDLKAVREKVMARPDKSATIEANAFLVVAQERLNLPAGKLKLAFWAGYFPIALIGVAIQFVIFLLYPFSRPATVRDASRIDPGIERSSASGISPGWRGSSGS